MTHIIDKLKCTLEAESLDEDKGVSMVKSQLLVCSFDRVKEWYVREVIPLANPNPKSNDVLYFGEDGCFFIEFKNGKISNEVKIFRQLEILLSVRLRANML